MTTGAEPIDQSEVIAFLNETCRLGAAAGGVVRFETHGALVFLTGNRAYKLKRAVNYPYMDFSTLEKRKQACHNEIARNKRAAPDIYLGAVPITRTADGSLAIGGDGEIVDWLVAMRRFEQDGLFSNLAHNDQLDSALMEPLAEAIADYHAKAEHHVSMDGDDRLAEVVSQVAKALLYGDGTLGLGDVRHFAGRVVNVLNAQSQLLKTRSARGCVRLCHGDLHLRNIVLIDGQPVLFDALEFDDRLATIDVLYDLAFLLMDLWQCGLKHHANLCFNNYAARAIPTEALSGLAALPLFAAVRAAVRAMVAVDRARTSAMQRGDGGDDRQEARRYLSFADQVLASTAPRLIAIGGVSGTGKSTVAAAVAPDVGQMPGALHLRSDVERKLMFGARPTERLPAQAYTDAASDSVYRRLCTRAETALNAGHSVIVDAVFTKPHHRRWIEQIAKRCGVPFSGVWLEAPETQLIDRVSRRTGDASDADAAVVRHQLAARSEVTCWMHVDAAAERSTVAHHVADHIAAFVR